MLPATVRVGHAAAEPVDAIPPAAHYVVVPDDPGLVRTLVPALLSRPGARITLVVAQVDAGVAEWMGHERVSIMPTWGPAAHLSEMTARSALQLACGGQRILAPGFISNSISALRARREGPAHTFVEMLREASEASETQRVVAAVISLHRTGSKFLHDLIGISAGARVAVVHEHKVPGAVAAVGGREGKVLRAAALRDAILSGERRYVFVAERDPVDRLLSYFIKRKGRWLRERLNVSGDFDDPGEIQRAWDAWIPPMCVMQRQWYRRVLRQQLGMDVLQATLTPDGVLRGRYDAGELLVVHTRQLNALREAVESAWGRHMPLSTNAAQAYGNQGVEPAVRLAVVVAPETRADLLSIPEVAHIQSLLSLVTVGSGPVLAT